MDHRAIIQTREDEIQRAMNAILEKEADDVRQKIIMEEARNRINMLKKTQSIARSKECKTSDRQRRWQAFQKFIWDDLKTKNPAVPFKEAMQAAGPRWAAGNPISEEDQAAFEAWLTAAAAKAEKSATTITNNNGHLIATPFINSLMGNLPAIPSTYKPGGCNGLL